MKVNPISETEALAPGIWKRGLYDFEVIAAEEQISKAGNDQIKLTNKLYDKEGKSRTVFDYLVSTAGMAYKVRHFASASGLLAQYERGELRADDCVGKTGRCQIGIEKKEGYPDKNSIQDYAATSGSRLIDSIPDSELNDEIPF